MLTRKALKFMLHSNNEMNLVNKTTHLLPTVLKISFRS